MFSKKLVTLPKLISYILSFTTENANKDVLENVFPTSIKSNDEFKFACLKYGETKNINDFPEKLKSIFDPYIKNFIRCGSRKTFDSDANLSLYYSILNHIVNDFHKLSLKDQLNYITKLRDKLIIFASTPEIMQSQEYDKLGWIKKDLMNSLVQFKTNKLVIKLIADYLNLNIFILNVVEDKMYVISENDFYDMFRSNMFLVFNDDIFESLVYSNTKLLDYNSGPIKKLVTVDKNLIILMDSNLSEHNPIIFNVKLSNINKYIKQLKINTIPTPVAIIENVVVNDIVTDTTTPEIVAENEYDEIMPNDSDINVYIKDIESNKIKKPIINESAQLVFKISGKMKLEELQLVAKKLNIDLQKTGKQKVRITKTKNDLIDEINEVLKNKK